MPPPQPALSLTINGSALSDATVLADLLMVTVEQDLNVPDMFALRLHNWDVENSKVIWSEDSRFAVGNEVSIGLGYTSRTEVLLVGEITGLEISFEEGSLPTLLVRGYDRSHRLMRGRKTRTFVKVKDSAIASEIARAAGLEPQVEDSGVVLDYVLQHNQTDLEFLQGRAAQIGYEMRVDDKTLFFSTHQTQTSSTLDLRLGNEIIEFSASLTTMQQVGEVVMRGWDPKAKAAIISRVPSSGGETGPQVANQAFGKSSVAIVDRPVFTKAEADQVAKGQYSDMALTFVRCTARCFGDPALRTGTLVTVAGLGDTFSGNYYIVSTQHRISQRTGYQTTFTAHRSST